MNRDTNRGIGSFATKAPRQTMIRDEPHMLAYINPQEEQMLRDMGGSGEAGPDGIPSYGWLSDTWSEITSGGGAETATYNNDTTFGAEGLEDDAYDSEGWLGNLGRDLSIGLGLSTPNASTLARFNKRTADTIAANKTAAAEAKEKDQNDDTSYTAPILSSKETLPSPTNAAVEDTTPVPRPSANFSYGYLPALNSLQSNSLVPAAQPAQPIRAANGEGQQYTFEELLAQFKDPYAVGMSQGGSVPKQTMIGDQPHMLAYINPEEEQTLRDMGGSGMPGPGGVPAYHIPPVPVDMVQSSPGTFTGETFTGSYDDGYGGRGNALVDATGKEFYYPEGFDGPAFSSIDEANNHLRFSDYKGQFDALKGKYDPNLIYSQDQFDAIDRQDPDLIYSQDQFDAIDRQDPDLIYSQTQFDAIDRQDPDLIYSQTQFDAIDRQDPNLIYSQDQFDAIDRQDPNLIYSQDQFDAIDRQDPDLIYSQSQFDDIDRQDPDLIYSQSQFDAIDRQDPDLIYSQSQFDAIDRQDPDLIYSRANFNKLKEDHAGEVGEFNPETGLYNTYSDLYDAKSGQYTDLLGTHGDYSDLDYSNLQDKYTGEGGLYTGLQTDYDAQGKLLGDLQKDYDEIEGLYEGAQQDYLNKQVLANSSGLPTNQQNPFRPASINPLQAPGTSNIVMPESYGNAGSYTFQELLDRYQPAYLRGS